MAQPSCIPGNPNLITETLYKPQEDYAFVNDCKSKAFRPNPYFIRERDGPFIQAYYQHYEADIPYKNAVFTPQVKPADLAHRQCNPLVAYPYGMPQIVEYEKCSKCKGNKKCSKRKTKRKSMKHVDGHAAEDLFSSKLKAENGPYEVQENTNDDSKHTDCIHIHNDVHEDDICKSESYFSNALSCSNNFKEVCACDMGINEKCNDNDINNNDLTDYNHAGAKESSSDSYIDDKIHGEMEKYFSHELKNSLHHSIENNEYSASMQNLFLNSNNMHKDGNTNAHDEADCKEDVIQGNEQYCVKVNDAEIRKHSSLRNINSDAVREEITNDKDKNDLILNQLTDVANGNIEDSQKENNNDDEIGSSTLMKLPKQQTYDDANVPVKNDSKNNIRSQELIAEVKEPPKNIKQVYICDNVETVSYHVDRKQSNDEDLTKCIIKKKKNKTNEVGTTTSKSKAEHEKQITPNKHASPNPERAKKPTQPRICHVEAMMIKNQKENTKSKQKGNDQNSLQPSVTNVDEFFPDVVKKTYVKNRIFHFPTNTNKELKNKVEEHINEVNSNSEESPRVQGIFRLINGTSSSSKPTNAPLNKKTGLANTNSGNDKSLQKLSDISLIKKKINISANSKKSANKKLVKKSNEDTSERKLVNKTINGQEEGSKKLKSKRLLSRSTTVFYGNEKPVPFKTTDVKRFTENVPVESEQLESLKSDETDNTIKKKKTKDSMKNKKDVITKVSNVSKELRNATITKKLKSKKKELYDNIISLTKNMKKKETDGVMNKKKGNTEQGSQKSTSKDENIFGKNVDKADVLGKMNSKKIKNAKEKIASTKRKEESKKADRVTETSPLKHKMKTIKGIKENAKDAKPEEKKRKINTQKSYNKELSKLK